MNNSWSWKWTALWILVLIVIGLVFYDNGRVLIEILIFMTGGDR